MKFYFGLIIFYPACITKRHVVTRLEEGDVNPTARTEHRPLTILVREREKYHVLSLMCGCQNSSELVWDRKHASKEPLRESEKILEMIGNMRWTKERKTHGTLFAKILSHNGTYIIIFAGTKEDRKRRGEKERKK